MNGTRAGGGSIWQLTAAAGYNDCMETTFQAPLTLEQLSAIAAGGGYARCEDPQRHVVYHLYEQGPAPTIDDDYVREKLAEAYADIEQNGLKPLDMEAVKEEFRRRLALKARGTQ